MTGEPAFIAIAEDGVVTLYWGDGTEEEKHVIVRGQRATHGQALLDAIEELKIWAEENGYQVIVPSYDLEVPDVEIDIPDQEADTLDPDEVDDLLDDLFFAGGGDEQ